MPKAKTHRGAAKRFKVSGSGKIVRNRSGHNHLLEKKTSQRKRRLRRGATVHETEVRRVRRMLNV